jgi:LysR family transcriptional regulator, glycine cleavage system transcriptional activator
MRRTTKSTTRSRQGANTLRRLPLAGLRVFVVAAEQLNFSRAAAELGVSTAAVSMQIRALEEYLRSPLFRRNGRFIALTEDGKALLPRVRRALDDLELAIDAMRADRRTGHLVVSMLPSFLQQWLLPRLPDFHAHHPAIDLRIDTSRALVDFVRSDVQVALRFGKGPWSNLYAEKLFEEWLVPVCAPLLLEKYGPVEHLVDTHRYPLLHSTSEPWSAWSSGKANEEWAVSGSSMDDSASIVRAAIAGQGLALVRWSLAADEVVSGRLAIASSKITCFERSYHFVCPEAWLSIEKVAAFRVWILEQAKTFVPPTARTTVTPPNANVQKA